MENKTILIFVIIISVGIIIPIYVWGIARENYWSTEIQDETLDEVFRSEREEYFEGLDECNKKYPNKSEEWNSCYEKVKAEVDFRP